MEKNQQKAHYSKFTAHRFRQVTDGYKSNIIGQSSVFKKTHEFWQPHSQAFPLYSQSVVNRKIDYIHNNPVSGKWQLAPTADAYRFSSANFYHHEVAAKTIFCLQ